MEPTNFDCRQANQIDLVDYLSSLGHRPRRIKGNEFWYLSPLWEEKTASFKVERTGNVWYDHGDGRGGKLVDFGILYHRCTVRELLARLAGYKPKSIFSFHQPLASKLVDAGERRDSLGKILVLNTRPLQAKSLIDYLRIRRIPTDIAARFCLEVDFSLGNKQQTAVGFLNRSGGYELRNLHFKGSSSPKDVTFFDNRKGEVAVFEGFFDFLSYQAIQPISRASSTNFVVLNSLAFLEKSRSLLEGHNRIHLFLDRDTAGYTYTEKAIHWNPEKYSDRSDFYQGRKDLNDWLVQFSMAVPTRIAGKTAGRSLR